LPGLAGAVGLAGDEVDAGAGEDFDDRQRTIESPRRECLYGGVGAVQDGSPGAPPLVVRTTAAPDGELCTAQEMPSLTACTCRAFSAAIRVHRRR
jgi:hypothetical protein